MPRGVAAGTGASRPTVAPELLARARGRLRRLLVLLAALSTAALALALANLHGTLNIGTPFGARLGVALHGALLGLELALIAVVRSHRLSDRRALDVALYWQIAICLAFSLFEPWIVWEEQGVIPRVTWSSLIIVAVPLLIPSTPRRMLIASTAAAITVPVGLLLLDAGGAVSVAPADLGGAIISPAFAVAASNLAARVVYGVSRDLARARQLGAYQLERPIGEGGMGQVWRGTHRLLARPAAVKLIRSEVLAGHDAPDAPLRRFEREARVTATLRSPHTVELYDFGVADDGTLYYVMELLDGLDLESLVRQHGRQPPARVAHLLRQACHSLAEAHEAGLVHRDIKPANLLVCRHGRDLDFVKVLDFGLVALASQHDIDSTSLTGEGRVAGTPAYIAPEMVSAPQSVDARVDLYSLGCVGYWLLTGKPVFHGDSPVEVIAGHLKDPPRPPSAVSEQEIPAELEALIMRCLAKSPDDRPGGAAELAEALARVEFLRPWDAAAMRAWWARHRSDRDAGTPADATTVTADRHLDAP